MKHSIHDFKNKLQQKSVVPHVADYVAWRRQLAALKNREGNGVEQPNPPIQAPISINLDLTTACNYRCTHCIDWDILNSKVRYHDDEVRSSIKVLAEHGLRSVILIGGGEPTIYPGFVDTVRYLKELELQVAVVTNGSRGDRVLEIAEYLGQDDWIRLSLDSGSDALFQAMHKPVHKKVNLDRICEWVTRFKKANPLPKVGYSFLITWRGAARDSDSIHENIHEIFEAAERAKSYGFDYIAFKPVLNRMSNGAEVMTPTSAEDGIHPTVRKIRQEIDRAKTLESDRFQVYEAINLRMLESGKWTDYTNQPRVCHMQAFRQVLTPMGLYNCPAHRGIDKARIAGRSAYVDESGLSNTTKQLAELQATFDASHECREVTCLYNDVNWWIDSMIEAKQNGADLIPSYEDHDFFL